MVELNFDEFDEDKDENSFWENGSFIQSVTREQVEEMKKTIDDIPNADKLFNCKKCNAKTTARNKNWHDRMCDECFNKTYFRK